MSPITKFLCVVTAVGSVAVFAIPESMLAWGFEAEAERFIQLREEAHHRRRQKEQSATGFKRKVEKTGSSINDDARLWYHRLHHHACIWPLRYYDKGFLTASSESSEWLLSMTVGVSIESPLFHLILRLIKQRGGCIRNIERKVGYWQQRSKYQTPKEPFKTVSESESIFAKKRSR